MSDYNADRLTAIAEQAKKLAIQNKHEFVTVEHLAAVCLQEEDVNDFLKASRVDVNAVFADIKLFFQSGHLSVRATDNPRPTKAIDEVIQATLANSMFSGVTTFGGIELLYNILSVRDVYVVKFMNERGITQQAIRTYMGPEEAAPSTRKGPSAQSKKGQLDQVLKVLAEYTTNLNERAKAAKIDPLIGRETEIHELVKTTARRTKNNTVLSGPEGVGKTAIVEGLAKLINDNEVPEVIQGATIYSLNVTAIMAGARFRGDMEERVQMVIKAIEFLTEEEKQKVILFIDEIHMIMETGSGSGSGMDIANILKPALARGGLRCIGSTTFDEYRKYFEKDKAFARRFNRIDVNEPSVEDTKRILNGAKRVYEDFHQVTYTNEAIDTVVDLAARYITNRYFPDKAFDIIDAAGATQRIAPEGERKTVIGVNEVELEVSKIAKIPTNTVQSSEVDKLEHLEDDLRKNVFGQEKAIEVLTESVYESRAGLRPSNKTLGSFLFVGPTGVGKTEMARQIADTLGMKLLKYDMSEYMEAHSVAKLIGSPPGYVGYGDGAAGSGKLVSDIETNPYSVLLLDEIEKAHPMVFNMFLQVMDDGKLSSASGKTVNFNNVLLILTSNAGAADAERNTIGFGGGTNSDSIEKEVNRLFAPEFRNRLDAVVPFKGLTPDLMGNIVNKFIKEISDMASAKGVRIEITPEAVEFLSVKGYDPKMGARPMRKTIKELVTKKLSKEMLFGALKNGGTAYIDANEGEINITFSEKFVMAATETETA